MVNLRDHSSRYPFPMSSTVRWDRPLLQTLVATHMRLLPCISWKTPKRNLCHLDWTFNIRTLNWTFTYGIGLEEENKFKFQFWTCHVRTIKPTLWVYSNGLWSYRKLSVLKKTSPAFRTYFPHLLLLFLLPRRGTLFGIVSTQKNNTAIIWLMRSWRQNISEPK